MRRFDVLTTVQVAGLMMAGAVVTSIVSCCPSADDILIEDGPRQIRHPFRPFADARIDVNRDALVIQYTGDDGHRYRVTYNIVSHMDEGSAGGGPGGPGWPPCERTWTGDFAAHADLLIGTTEVTGDVRLEAHPRSELGWMHCLDVIHGDLVIAGNETLESLNGFNIDGWIGGDLRITGNPALTSVRALEGASLHGALSITDNLELPQCAAETLADALAVPPERREIRDNLGMGECGEGLDVASLSLMSTQ